MAETLHESTLWKVYDAKTTDTMRKNWVEKVYNSAVAWLGTIPKIFSNYTLHNQVHVLNVMHAIAGLLGDQIEQISVGECELLILAAALHDIGMVYTDKAIKEAAADVAELRRFERDYEPDYYGVPYEKLRKEKDEKPLSTLQQGYLRSLHPFRLPELLSDQCWDFEHKPHTVVPQTVIVSVCQAHGKEQAYLESDAELAYIPDLDVDPRFCALLLRLGDILDFDGSRAPEILSVFAEGIARSEEAYQKHLSSYGFTYPPTPSDQPLAYRADCNDPNIHFKIQRYLNGVDQELLVAAKVRKRCEKDWQRGFHFPRSVDRRGISCNNFESELFSVTMDQGQILKLLTGENLYSDKGVFIRELLQNAVDATLLRGKLDPDFDVESEEAAIYFWSGMNAAGELILRIDDHGTGMTRRMLHHYFLKVGKSYYQSEELKQDLARFNAKDDYTGISRFGIGFLSCFLCGKAAEVSTLYCRPEKAREDCGDKPPKQEKYGLRAVIPGLTGHYALHNQAYQHLIGRVLPAPNGIDTSLLKGMELRGYRQEPGTSIVVTLDPGKLGTLDLQAELEKVLCAPRMPVYYNGKRIGRTYREMMDEARRLNGTVYEMSDEEKREFDMIVSPFAGQYPVLSLKAIVLEPSDFPKVEGVSIISIQPELDYYKRTVSEKGKKYYLKLSIENANGKGILIRLTLSDEMHSASGSLTAFRSVPLLSRLIGNGCPVAFHGIFAANIENRDYRTSKDTLLAYLEGRQQPHVDLGRSTISALPGEAELALRVAADHLDIHLREFAASNTRHLRFWRKLRNSEIGKYAGEKLHAYKTELIDFLEDPKDDIASWRYIYSRNDFLSLYFIAELQDNYDITISHVFGDKLCFSKKTEPTDKSPYDVFPPMPFALAKNEQSRSFLCVAAPSDRRGITADHVYAKWLIENADAMRRSFPTQFDMLVRCFRENMSNEIIEAANAFRDQLVLLKRIGKTQLALPPELTEADFLLPPKTS